MRFPQAYVLKGQLPTGVTGFTGAAPQTLASAALDSGLVGSYLAARVYAKATTNTLTITGKWQVLDDDGSSWRDAIDQTNVADTILVTGTGSAVTAVKVISAPNSCLAGGRQCRFLLTTGVASGGGAGTDEGSIAYEYRQPVNVLGS